MSALRLPGLLPGQPSRLIPVDSGCTPRRIGPYYLQGVAVTAVQTVTTKKPLTPEQRAKANERMREYHKADPQRALERQRRYRKRMKGVA